MKKIEVMCWRLTIQDDFLTGPPIEIRFGSWSVAKDVAKRDAEAYAAEVKLNGLGPRYPLLTWPSVQPTGNGGYVVHCEVNHEDTVREFHRIYRLQKETVEWTVFEASDTEKGLRPILDLLGNARYQGNARDGGCLSPGQVGSPA